MVLKTIIKKILKTKNKVNNKYFNYNTNINEIIGEFLSKKQKNLIDVIINNEKASKKKEDKFKNNIKTLDDKSLKNDKSIYEEHIKKLKEILNNDGTINLYKGIVKKSYFKEKILINNFKVND